jgi:hypothetical protein
VPKPPRPERRSRPEPPRRPGPGPGPSPFADVGDLASWEQSMAVAMGMVNRMVQATRKSAAVQGQTGALNSMGFAVSMMPPEHLPGAFQAAIARLAFPPEELPEP